MLTSGRYDKQTENSKPSPQQQSEEKPRTNKALLSRMIFSLGTAIVAQRKAQRAVFVSIISLAEFWFLWSRLGDCL